MPGIKELKTRIKSIGSTRKITRAMQMVSAAKMRKAQAAALNSRTYSELAWELIHNLNGNTAGSNVEPVAWENESKNKPGMAELMKTFPKAAKTGIIVISSNKGLVGGFNANLISKLKELDNRPVDDRTVAELFVMGRKAKDYAVRFNKNLVADFTKSDSWESIESIYPLAKMVSDLYLSGEYKNILIVYNKFISTLTQKVTVKQLLPFVSELATSNSQLATPPDYIFEPSPETVLNNLLPRIIESQIYQAVLESDASEHSARMVMMKNATEAAGDLISDLTLTYNQLRQSKITTELSEITAGRIALE